MEFCILRFHAGPPYEVSEDHLTCTGDHFRAYYYVHMFLCQHLAMCPNFFSGGLKLLVTHVHYEFTLSLSVCRIAGHRVQDSEQGVGVLVEAWFPMSVQQ